MLINYWLYCVSGGGEAAAAVVNTFFRLEYNLYIYTAGHWWVMLFICTLTGLNCNADTFLYILWNAKQCSKFVADNYLIWFDNMDALITINHFTTNPGYWQICVEHVLTRSVLPLDRDEVKTDLMLTNMKNDLCPLISTIVPKKILTLCYPVYFETLAVIYWISCVTLKNQREKSLTYISYTKSWF